MSILRKLMFRFKKVVKKPIPIVRGVLSTLLIVSLVAGSFLVLAPEKVRAAPADCYWVGGTGNWSDDLNHWAITSGGAPGTGNKPDATSNVFFDANSYSGAGQATTVDETANCLSMNWTGATNSPTLNGVSILNIYGNLITIAAMTWSRTGSTVMKATSGTKTITTNGLTIGATTGNFQLNGSGGTFQLADDFRLGGTYTWANTAGTFDPNGKTFYFLGTSHSLQGSTTFANLTRYGTATKTDSLTLTSGTTQTVTGTLTLSGNSTTNRLLVESGTLGTSANFTATTVSAQNVDFVDIAMTNAVDLSAITGKSGDCAGNSGITFTTATAQNSTGAGTWGDATKWTSRVPLPQDNVTVSHNMTANQPRLGKDITYTGTPTVILDAEVNNGTVRIYGSYTLTSGMTYTTANSTVLSMRGRGGSFTITSAGKNIGRVSVAAYGGTVTLQDDFVGYFLSVSSNATLDFNDKNATIIFGNGGYFSAASSLGVTVYLGSGTITTDGSFGIGDLCTLYAETSTITAKRTTTTPYAFAGGNKIFNNFNVMGTANYQVNITGNNTFNVITGNASQAAKTLAFATGSNTTLTDLQRDPGGTNSLGIYSAGASYLTKTDSTPILLDYLTIANSEASPGNTFYAGTHSTDAGGNSGWIFTDADLTVTTNAATSISMTNEGLTTGNFNATITTLAGTPYITTAYNYGLTASYGSNTTGVAKYAYGAYSASIPNDLTPGETYHFRADILNGNGNFYGAGANFTLTMPTVTTSEVASRRYSSIQSYATLAGAVANMGIASNATYRFNWGYSGAYGENTTATVVSGIGSQSIEIPVNSGVTVYYRSSITVDNVSAYGAQQTFTSLKQADAYSGVEDVAAITPMLLVIGLLIGSGLVAWKGFAYRSPMLISIAIIMMGIAFAMLPIVIDAVNNILTR